MLRHPRISIVLILSGFAVVWPSPAAAQLDVEPAPLTVEPGTLAFENARGGAAARRAPGNIVSAGVARAIAANNSGVRKFEISEVDGEVSFQTEFLTQAIEIIFDQLNEALVLFENLLLARAGRAPSLASELIPGAKGLGDLANRFGGR